MDLEQIYQDYFSKVYKYILSLSHDPLTAEEITQETFFKALKKIDGFRGECSLRVWLCQIAKNAYYDQLTRRARTEPAKVGELPAAAFEDDLIAGLEAQAIRRVLHGLREPYKEVFSLRVFGELSFAEIAELFEKSESWARVTYHRARLMIREGLEHDERKL
ncbi:MAG: RNA polymerase sigma factor [Firmicutes bacterium]|nr:RNA polymerase sigma factor [Bacillota bacterium]